MMLYRIKRRYQEGERKKENKKIDGEGVEQKKRERDMERGSWENAGELRLKEGG